MPQRTKLNGQERVMLQELANGKTPIQSATKAYNVSSKRSASTIASRVMKRDRFILALKNAGLTDNQLAKKFVKLINQKKPMVINNKVRMFADGTTQLNTLKTIIKIKGYMNEQDSQSQDEEPLIVKLIRFEDNRVIVKDNT